MCHVVIEQQLEASRRPADTRGDPIRRHIFKRIAIDVLSEEFSVDFLLHDSGP